MAILLTSILQKWFPGKWSGKGAQGGTDGHAASLERRDSVWECPRLGGGGGPGCSSPARWGQNGSTGAHFLQLREDSGTQRSTVVLPEVRAASPTDWIRSFRHEACAFLSTLFPQQVGRKGDTCQVPCSATDWPNACTTRARNTRVDGGKGKVSSAHRGETGSVRNDPSGPAAGGEPLLSPAKEEPALGVRGSRVRAGSDW